MIYKTEQEYNMYFTHYAGVAPISRREELHWVRAILLNCYTWNEVNRQILMRCGNSREGLSLWQGTHISTEGNDNTPTDTWVSKGATKREEFMGKKGAGGHLTNLYIWKIKVQSFLNSLNTLGIIFKFYFIFLPPPSHPAAFRQTFVYLLGRWRKAQQVLCAAICAILGASKASTSHDKETQG